MLLAIIYPFHIYHPQREKLKLSWYAYTCRYMPMKHALSPLYDKSVCTDFVFSLTKDFTILYIDKQSFYHQSFLWFVSLNPAFLLCTHIIVMPYTCWNHRFYGDFCWFFGKFDIYSIRLKWPWRKPFLDIIFHRHFAQIFLKNDDCIGISHIQTALIIF